LDKDGKVSEYSFNKENKNFNKYYVKIVIKALKKQKVIL
jgi:hypothetical protein